MELKINGKFTADDLRQIADAMDNPNLRDGMTMEEYAERVEMK